MKSKLMSQRKNATVGSDPWVNNRDEKAEVKLPETVEVPRLAASKKIALPLPGAPAAGGALPAGPAATPPASPAAPVSAPPAVGGPMPQQPKSTQSGNGNVSADIKQMSSKSLADMISAIAKQADPNDKALMDFIEALSKELKGRPIEVEQAAGKSAALNLFDGLKLALYEPGLGHFDPGPAEAEEGVDPNIPRCDQCEMAAINGVNCHETGCRNQSSDWDPETQQWARSVDCRECGDKVREGERCNCMDPEPMDRDENGGQFHFGGLNVVAIENKKGNATGGSWVNDQATGDVEESGGRTSEVEAAHKLVDEAPATLDRPETTLPEKLAADKEMKAQTALKKVEKLADRLKEMYLDAKEITQVNDSRFVREAVESIYRAYDLFGQAAKVLGKQKMQEQAEDDALKVKEKAKKKGGMLDNLVLAAEDGDDAKCEGCGEDHSNRRNGYMSEYCKRCEKQQKPEPKEKPHGKDW